MPIVEGILAVAMKKPKLLIPALKFIAPIQNATKVIGMAAYMEIFVESID